MSGNTRDIPSSARGGGDLLHHVMIASTSARLTDTLMRMHPAIICHSGVWSVDGLRSHGASGGAMVRAAH